MPEQRLSNTVQNYLVTTLRLREDAESPVPLSRLAQELSVSPISVNDMCRRLQDQGLMEYRPYKGALLTETGQRHAYDIIRRHRLWEVFLVEHLRFDFDSAHEAAHRLEHATADLVADRMDAFLGFPTVNPQGEPIPRREGVLPECVTLPLSDVDAGTWAHILRADVTPAAESELYAQGVRPGARLQVLMASDKGLLLDVDGAQVSLARALAETILVEPLGEDEETPPCTMQALADGDPDATPAEPACLPEVERVTLADLDVGQKGAVVRMGLRGPARQRMLDMGLVPGAEVEVVRRAPMGDPTEYRIKGYSLSLRKDEAQYVTVEIEQE